MAGAPAHYRSTGCISHWRTASDLSGQLPWHNGSNVLPEDPSEPYFVAKDYGPIFLNVDPTTGYKVVQPLVQNSANFSNGTIIMSTT
jgi:hypothetical protein